jgi:chromodomain-helicase-DNA-binding protein 1
MSESDGSSPGDASHDGDFDMEESAPSPPDHEEHEHHQLERASSSDSIANTKRKAEFDEEEYIRANPELYGLRRSVLQSCAAKIFLGPTCAN